MIPADAYYEIIATGITEELQKTACEDPYWACALAEFVDDANIEYCQEAACKDPWSAFCFAIRVDEADIEYCKAHMGAYLNRYLVRQMSQSLK